MNNKDAVKTNVLLLVIFMLIVISAAVFFNLKNGLGGGSDVVISGGYMTDGVDAWNNFVQKTSSNKKAFVRIKFKSKNGVSKAVLKYKNGKYYYTDANGKEYSDKYLLDLSGKLTDDDEFATRIICLAHENTYTFKDVMGGYVQTTGDDKKCTIILSLVSKGTENVNTNSNVNTDSNINTNIDTNSNNSVIEQPDAGVDSSYDAGTSIDTPSSDIVIPSN